MSTTKLAVSIRPAAEFGGAKGYVLAAPVHYSGARGLLDRMGRASFLWPPYLRETVVFATRKEAKQEMAALARRDTAAREKEAAEAGAVVAISRIAACRMLRAYAKASPAAKLETERALAAGLVSLNTR